MLIWLLQGSARMEAAIPFPMRQSLYGASQSPSGSRSRSRIAQTIAPHTFLSVGTVCADGGGTDNNNKNNPSI